MNKVKKIRIGYSDGNYWLEEYAGTLGMFPIEISDGEWLAYQAFCEQAKYWHNRCRDLGNIQFEQDNPKWDNS